MRKIEMDDDIMSIGFYLQVKGFYKGKPCFKFCHLMMSILVMVAQFFVLHTVATKELNFTFQYEDRF